MKKLMLILLSVIVAASAGAQDKKTPDVVKNAFKKEFPQITKVDWGMENGLYEAEFTINGKEASANYSKDGVLKEFEMAIEKKDLPAGVLEYVKSHFDGYRITETAKITDDKNVVTFEVEVTKSGKSSDLIFDTKGNFLLKK